MTHLLTRGKTEGHGMHGDINKKIGAQLLN